MPESLTTVAYLFAGVLFILSLAGLSAQESARRGNGFGIAGMALAVAVNDCVGLFPRMSANFAAAAHRHHRTTAVSVAACVPGTG